MGRVGTRVLRLVGVAVTFLLMLGGLVFAAEKPKPAAPPTIDIAALSAKAATPEHQAKTLRTRENMARSDLNAQRKAAAQNLKALRQRLYETKQQVGSTTGRPTTEKVVE